MLGWQSPPPPGPGQVSFCPIDGQAHAEPLADLLTQAACPIPSFLVNSGYSGTVLSSAPRGALQPHEPHQPHLSKALQMGLPRLPGGLHQASLPGLLQGLWDGDL